MTKSDIKKHRWQTSLDKDGNVVARPVFNMESTADYYESDNTMPIEVFAKQHTYPSPSLPENIIIDGKGLEPYYVERLGIRDEWQPCEIDGRDPIWKSGYEQRLALRRKTVPEQKQESVAKKDASDYFMLSNVPGKQQDGINPDLLALWSNIEIWYGDPKKTETGRDFLLRMQALFDIRLRGNDAGNLLVNGFIQKSQSATIKACLEYVAKHVAYKFDGDGEWVIDEVALFAMKGDILKHINK